MSQHEDPSMLRRAVLFALAGEGILTLMDALIKGLTARYPTFQITFLRFACGSIVAVLLWLWLRPGLPTQDALRYQGLRAILAVVTATSFFYGLSKVQIAEAMALSFLSPLFIAFFAVVLLKERFDPRTGFALAGGIIGMAIIVSGQYVGGNYTVETLKGVAAITVATVCYALVIILLRARANVDPIPVIILLQNVLPAIPLAPAAAYVWTPLSGNDFAMFCLIGCLGVGGHLCIANAFKRAEAAKLAPVHYSILVWGILFGYLLFGDVPTWTTVVGAAFIVGATLLTQKK